MGFKEAIEHARKFAIQAHGDQMYGDGTIPYVVHLDMVAGVLREFGFTKDALLLQAAFLHDTVEDTYVTDQILLDNGFSAVVAAAVAFCTDEKGKNRKERKKLTYEKQVGLLNRRPIDDSTRLGLLVKWADRVANIRACHIWPAKNLLPMYVKEGEETALCFRLVP